LIEIVDIAPGSTAEKLNIKQGDIFPQQEKSAMSSIISSWLPIAYHDRDAHFGEEKSVSLDRKLIPGASICSLSSPDAEAKYLHRSDAARLP
jgi:hypothetical protein